MNNNISLMTNCYGCGVCALACNKDIISIRLNSDGFYAPIIEKEELCTNCGLCLNVCAYNNEHISQPTDAIQQSYYAAWSNYITTRYSCSSGGISFEIGSLLLKNGYNACCVKYNIEDERSEHYIAQSLDELKESIGSKYIPSYTLTGFKQLNRTNKFFVTGTPCQIDSLRRYIKTFKLQHNFILVDFFCHGVPSMLVWQKYLKRVKQNTGKINSLTWRDKETGWHDSWSINIKGDKKNINSLQSKGDVFYQLFLGNKCLSKACYEQCKYKATNSAADIRIGDLWGTKYKDNKEGVSGVITFTSKGKEIIELLETCEIKKETSATILEGQMITAPRKSYSYNFVYHTLKSNYVGIRVIASCARIIDGICYRILKK